MAKLRSLSLSAVVGVLLCSTAAFAQQATTHVAPAVRITTPIDNGDLVTLHGNVNPLANPKNDRGPVAAGFALPDLTLVLSRSPEQQAAFGQYVASEYDPNSPNYHQWLTPAQIGEEYGPAEADIATISGWLTSQGFAIKSVAPDRMTIRFSGTAGQAEAAFHAQIHNLSVNGATHYANMTDPQIPAALSPVVVGVKALHNFLPHPLHRLGSKVEFDKQTGKWERIAAIAPTTSLAPVTGAASTPLTLAAAAKAATAGGGVHPMFGINVPANLSEETPAYLEEDVTPWDFATIYNVKPLWTSGITGSGETIAIAGTSEIDLNDVATYRTAFDLPSGTPAPVEIDTGDGPKATVCTSTSPYAACGIGDLEENSLDVEVSGAVATAAQIKLVVTGQNSEGTIDTVFDSAQYVVQNLTAKILSVSYGLCELEQGTSGNVAYYDLWQSAAAEGISVFVAAGDSGSPACDDGGDEYGNPYTAQYGLTVSGMASTPYDTAVGGTDFSWCKPTLNSSGDIEGCPASSSDQGSPAYWNTTNNTSEGGESAAGYIPEVPWNDTCENPIWASYLESAATYLGTFGSAGSTPEEACSWDYNEWYEIYEQYDGEVDLSLFVDTVGGSGGASNCVVNSTNPDSENLGTCTSGSTNTGSANGSLPLTNDGWPAPSWQVDSGATGTSGLTTRAIPDVSFFAGDGWDYSATLICVSQLGACETSAEVGTNPVPAEPTAQEVGGTSVGSPEMAGVMALIDQKAGAAQGLANPELYKLASQENYSNCSASTVTTSSANCYFNDIDTGTNTMACDLPGGIEGGDEGEEYDGIPSPNCVAINSGDSVGTLVSSGTTPAYNAAVGYDMATGLGSLNVDNVVTAWASDAGTGSSTMTVTLSPTGTISAGAALTVTVTVAGSSTLGTPTGTVSVVGGGYSTSQTLASGSGANTGAATITIPANSLAPGSDTLTITYSGDGNYASTSQTETVTVAAVVPTVTVVAPASENIANSVYVSVTVSGPAGASTPTGTVNLIGGGYSSTAVTLSSAGTATFTIPANTLALGSDTLTATYSASSTYAAATGSATIDIVNTATSVATITVTTSPSPASIDSGQSLGVTVTVAGSGVAPTGDVSLTAGSYNSGEQVLTGGTATFTIPANTFSSTGTVTLTATYSGDANYAGGTKTATVTVTQSAYALTAGTPSPSSVAPGANATVTITGQQSTTDYSGTVTLSSCTVTAGPSDAVNVPGCSVTGTITYASGTPSGSGMATVTTSANTAMNHPDVGNGKGWLGAGSGAVLAVLVFFWIPKRRRSLLAMFGTLAIAVTLGSLTGCGGGVTSTGTGTTTSTATTAGAYTFQVTGTGSDPASTSENVTFTVTVN